MRQNKSYLVERFTSLTVDNPARFYVDARDAHEAAEYKLYTDTTRIKVYELVEHFAVERTLIPK